MPSNLDLAAIKAAYSKWRDLACGFDPDDFIDGWGRDDRDNIAFLLNATPALVAEVERLRSDNAATDGTDAAHPSYWRGSDATFAAMSEQLRKILDGEDDCIGVCQEPWDSLRRRVLGLMKRRDDLLESNNRYEQYARDARAAHLANGKILEAVQLALVRSEEEVERLERELATAKAVGAAEDAIIFVPTGERKWQFQAMEYFLTEEGNIAYFNQPTDWPYAKDNPRPIYKMERAAEIRKGIK